MRGVAATAITIARSPCCMTGRRLRRRGPTTTPAPRAAHSVALLLLANRDGASSTAAADDDAGPLDGLSHVCFAVVAVAVPVAYARARELRRQGSVI